MPVPVLAIVALLANATVRVLTRPHIWFFLLGWIVVSKFDLGIFADEAKETVADLWWVVVLILLTLIAMTAVKAHASQGRRKTKR